ncbi:hypothetical protein B0H19DRAFT_1064264 [Mycena capillaripes]|nr:hypothetical protein B0H19DRAFT_1064264 [Mycena capillaripes]
MVATTTSAAVLPPVAATRDAKIESHQEIELCNAVRVLILLRLLRTGLGPRFKITAKTVSRNRESFIAWIFVQALSHRSGTSSDACSGCRPLVVGPHAVKIQR